MFCKGMLVKFKKLKNTRGYPFTGEILSINLVDGVSQATIKTYGLQWIGRTSEVNGILLDDIEEC